MGKIYVVGIGPGAADMMTAQADRALRNSDVIIGYRTYVDLIKDAYPDADFMSTNMQEEVERCRLAVSVAGSGKIVSLICSGDAGVYGMSSPLLELLHGSEFLRHDPDFSRIKDSAEQFGSMTLSEIEVEIIPGVTAACSGAALLGAPLSGDFCVISLSDYLTPWEVIEKRLVCAAEGDFCIAIYNPGSHARSDYLAKACEIISSVTGDDRCAGYVKNIGRSGQSFKTCTLGDLKHIEADMATTAFVGNSQTYIRNGLLITPRGYAF